MSRRSWLWVGLGSSLALVLSVSVEPLLPWWFAPPLVVLIVIGAAIDGQLPASAAAAIWGGLVLDLASHGRFGIRWLALLVVALAAAESRRLVAIRDLPWLWPIWFGIGSFLATLPVAILTQQLPLVVRQGIAAALWGPIALISVHWIAVSRRDHR